MTAHSASSGTPLLQVCALPLHTDATFDRPTAQCYTHKHSPSAVGNVAVDATVQLPAATALATMQKQDGSWKPYHATDAYQNTKQT